MSNPKPQHLFLVGLLALSAYGCNDSDDNVSSQVNPSTSVAHTTLYNDNFYDDFGTTDAPKRSVVISNQASYESEAAKYGAGSFPPVDFTSSQVVLIDAGSKPSGGHSIAVADAFTDGNSVIVEIDFTSPGTNENCRVTHEFTQPILIVSINSRSEIMLSERMAVTFCDQ